MAERLRFTPLSLLGYSTRVTKYRQVRAPIGYPGKVYSWGDRVLEHHLIWWRNTGTIVPKGWIIHHRNKNGKDNRFKNLELMRAGDHTTHHHLVCKLKERIVCAFCKKSVWRFSRDIRSKKAAGQKRFFCSMLHAARWQRGRHPFKHGTATGYGYHKCRCKVCRKAHSNRINERQKKLRRAICLSARH